MKPGKQQGSTVIATDVTKPIAGRIALLLAAALLAACGAQSPDKLLASARDYLAKGDSNAAVIQLKNVLQQSPDHGEARRLLGGALIEKRDFVSAEKELRRALELGQSPDAVLPALGRAMFEQGEYRKLVGEFGQRALTDADAQARFSTLLGDAYLRQGKTAEAGAAYGAALKARPDYALARLGQATLAAIAGNRDEALKGAEAVIAASPKVAEAYALKADLLAASGNRAEARKALEQAVDANGTYLPARKALTQILISEKAYDQAAAQIDAARKVAHGDLSLTYLQGTLELEKGEVQKARDSAAQLLKYAPEHVPTLVLAGAVELRSKQFATGEEYLRRALAKAPNHAAARRLLVGAYLPEGQPARALETLQPLLATDANKDPRVMMLAGETYLANGDVKRAAEQFSSAAAAEPVKAAAQTRLGQLALARGDTDEGFKQLESAAEQDASNVRADLALITAHLRRNEFDKALAAARALEKKQPKNPLAPLMLGTVELARKDPAAARKHFERSLQLQPTYLAAVVALAKLDVAEKKPEDARNRFEALIAADSKNEMAYLGLAELLAATGAKPDELAATLQRAIGANPQAVNARLALVNLRLRERNAKAALQVAEEASAVMPDDPRVLAALAAAQEAAGNLNQAIDALKRLTALQPQSTQPLLQLAGLHARNQEFDAAIDALLRAQRVAPDDRNVRANLIAMYVRKGRFDDALKESKAMQAKEPRFAGGYALEGDVRAGQKNWAEAERAYREALKLEPQASRVAAQLHSTLLAAGKNSDADAYARKWLADHPKDAAMRMYLADRALAAKSRKVAFGLYQEVIALDPNNAVALNNLAVVAGELGDARAIGYAERALKLVPNNAALLDTLGTLLVNKGDVEKGFSYLDQARAVAPNVPVLRLNYAKALMKAGRKDEARKELESLKATTDAFAGKDEIDGLLKSP
jgi:putative PEP-CTERM system TPR-repeat lipoprotein